MKAYTTGEAAKILGYKKKDGSWDDRRVARLIDSDQLQGYLKPITWQRRTHRLVSLKSLIEYMRQYKIPFDGFADDIDAQRWILCHQTTEIKKMIEKAGRRSGVLSGLKGLAGNLLEVVHNLDPLDNLQGASEDRLRAEIFGKLAEVINRNVGVRSLIARPKTK